jgi:hypothetical protein
MKDIAENRGARHLQAEVEDELAQVGSFLDPVGDDEEEADLYVTRLHSLSDATSAVAAYEERNDNT